jgi:hypothetical protein
MEQTATYATHGQNYKNDTHPRWSIPDVSAKPDAIEETPAS